MTPQECGGQIVEDSDTNEVVCKECGLVVSDGNETGSSTDADWGKYDDVDLTGSIEPGSTDHVHWSEQTSPAIVVLIKEPEHTYYEYHRIENPKEFFEGCSNEQDELQRIRERT